LKIKGLGEKAAFARFVDGPIGQVSPPYGVGKGNFSLKEVAGMAKKGLRVFAVVLSFIILGVLAETACAAEVPRMSTEELNALLSSPEVVIIDVRTGGDWDKSKEKIKGAVREDPNKNAKSWADKYSKDETIILYCS
jgi:hypothetical protein